MSSTAAKTRAGSFMPKKVKQEGVLKATPVVPPKNPPKENPPIAEQHNKKDLSTIVSRAHYLVTVGDEIEFDRIDDILRKKGIRGFDRSKLIRLALRLAFCDMDKINIHEIAQNILDIKKKSK